VNSSLIDRVRERLAAESASLRPNVVAAAIRAESGGVLGDTEVLSNLRVLQTELTGAGILEPLLRADGTTDVLVTAPDSVWVDDGNGLRRSSIRFADDAAVQRLAQRLALSVGRRLDEAQPWVDGQLSGLGIGDLVVPACRCGYCARPPRTSTRWSEPAPSPRTRSGCSPRSSGRGWLSSFRAERARVRPRCCPLRWAPCRQANASYASRTHRNWRRGIRIWSGWSRGARTSRASVR
jgi:hypothetical protein